MKLHVETQEEDSAEPPCDRGRHLLITDRDIATAVVGADRDPHAFGVADVMSREVVTACEQDSMLDLLAAAVGAAQRHEVSVKARTD